MEKVIGCNLTKNKYDNLSHIAGTLKYGEFYGTKRKQFFIAYSVLTTLFILGMIASIIALASEQVNKPNPMPTVNFVFLNIGISIGFLITPIILLVIIIKNEKTRAEIKLWLQDAIELGA